METVHTRCVYYSDQIKVQKKRIFFLDPVWTLETLVKDPDVKEKSIVTRPDDGEIGRRVSRV